MPSRFRVEGLGFRATGYRVLVLGLYSRAGIRGRDLW